MQPGITVSQLAGTWTSAEGSGAITFYPNHTFAAARLDLDGLYAVTCHPPESASGTWEFLSPDGASVPDLVEYSSGYIIGLTFADLHSKPTSSCASVWGMTQLTTWQIDGPLGLCADLDPDSPCAGEPWVWQKRPAMDRQPRLRQGTCVWLNAPSLLSVHQRADQKCMHTRPSAYCPLPPRTGRPDLVVAPPLMHGAYLPSRASPRGRLAQLREPSPRGRVPIYRRPG
jgi:hypothetical protein